MNFINNWQRSITLAQGATSAALALPDGNYRLTLADSATDATVWEIVQAVVADGTATLTRGLEGTTDLLWPTGSVIYCDVTAGALEQGGREILAAQDGVALALPEQSTIVAAALFAGLATPLVLPDVELAGSAGRRLTWSLQLLLDAPGSLVLQLPAAYPMLYADFAGTGLEIAASYNAGTNALTITPTGASAQHNLDMEATYYDTGGGSLAMDVLLRVLPIESTTSIHAPA